MINLNRSIFSPIIIKNPQGVNCRRNLHCDQVFSWYQYSYYKVKMLSAEPGGSYPTTGHNSTQFLKKTPASHQGQPICQTYTFSYYEAEHTLLLLININLYTGVISQFQMWVQLLTNSSFFGTVSMLGIHQKIDKRFHLISQALR